MSLIYNNQSVPSNWDTEYYSSTYDRVGTPICIYGNPHGIKVHEVKFWDGNNNLISHMIPHEENGQSGLCCSIRNEFLPTQTLA